ncbi:kinesin-like protein [Phytophthora cinnamomi]|uniref:kinesin-like protein n=1 Tax=Phytophthora cinnamomi TaxID=4785 RepID=UPI00355A971C|nr:kinesin-like protein [Phytophthora cinnamomi]
MATTCADENLADTVEQLRAELRRKDEELRRKDEELRAARAQFSELEECSREVEQELESEISRLNRRNNELENVNRNLERRLENELRRVAPVQMQPSIRSTEVAQLRQRLQRLEQDNDDLQTCVRRLEATQEDLDNKLERAEEQIIFAQQEFDDFNCEVEVATKRLRDQIQDLTAEVKMYKTFLSLSCFLQFGLPQKFDKSTDIIKDIHEPPCSDTDDTDEEVNGDDDGDKFEDDFVTSGEK